MAEATQQPIILQLRQVWQGGLKSEMPGIYVRKHNDSHRILCHLCFDCLPGLLDYLGVKMPE